MQIKTLPIIAALLGILFNTSFANEQSFCEQTRIDFLLLKQRWEKETPVYSSNTMDYWQGEAALGILNMGRSVLPFIFEEINKGNFFFNFAAEKITRVNLRTKQAASEQALSKLWVLWWDRHKHDPEWNLCLDRNPE